MSPFELGVSLGELVHVISEHGLQLSSQCSIQLSHPLGHDFLKLASSTQVSKPKHLWIGRGDGLRLYIRLAIEGLVVDEMERQDLLEELGIIIRDSQIWSQLLFNVSLTIPARDAYNRPYDADMIFLLTCSEDHSPKSQSRASKYGFSTLDARPPDGITSAKAEGVLLSLEISRTKGNAHKRRRGDVQFETTDFADTNDMLFSSDYTSYASMTSSSSSSSSLKSTPFSDSSQGNYSYVSSQSTSNSHEAVMLEDEPEHNTTADGKVFQLYNNPAIATQPNCSYLNPPRKRSGMSVFYTMNDLDSGASTKLIDAAIRSMICDDRTVLLPGVGLQQKSSAPKLAEILPAMFSPGYLQAMSQRNHFIPRIAHSTASIARNSNSSLLSSRLDALIDQSAANDHHEQNVSEESHKGTSRMKEHRHTAVLQVVLWKMIQRQLYDPLAARQLKPLQMEPTGTSKLAASLNDMLDDDSSPYLLLDQSCSPIHHQPNHEERSDLLFNDSGDDDNLFEDLDANLLDESGSERDAERVMLDEIDPFDDDVFSAYMPDSSSYQSGSIPCGSSDNLTGLELSPITNINMLFDAPEQSMRPPLEDDEELLL